MCLSCGMWDLVPWIGLELGPPELGAWSLSHWTITEVPPNTYCPSGTSALLALGVIITWHLCIKIQLTSPCPWWWSASLLHLIHRPLWSREPHLLLLWRKRLNRNQIYLGNFGIWRAYGLGLQHSCLRSGTSVRMFVWGSLEVSWVISGLKWLQPCTNYFPLLLHVG